MIYIKKIITVIAFMLCSCSNKEFSMFVNEEFYSENQYKPVRLILVYQNDNLFLNYSVGNQIIEVGIFAKVELEEHKYVRVNTAAVVIPKIEKIRSSESDTLTISVNDITSILGDSYLSIPSFNYIGSDCYINDSLYTISEKNNIKIHKKNLYQEDYLFFSTINYSFETIVVDKLNDVSECKIYLFHNYKFAPTEDLSDQRINILYFDYESKKLGMYGDTMNLKEINDEVYIP